MTSEQKFRDTIDDLKAELGDWLDYLDEIEIPHRTATEEEFYQKEEAYKSQIQQLQINNAVYIEALNYIIEKSQAAYVDKLSKEECYRVFEILQEHGVELAVVSAMTVIHNAKTAADIAKKALGKD